MCSVLGAMCSVFSRMCSLWRGRCVQLEEVEIPHSTSSGQAVRQAQGRFSGDAGMTGVCPLGRGDVFVLGPMCPVFGGAPGLGLGLRWERVLLQGGMEGVRRFLRDPGNGGRGWR